MKKTISFLTAVMLFISMYLFAASSEPQFNNSNYYLLGWSKDGKLAIIEKNIWSDVSLSSGIHLTVKIINIVNDKILYSKQESVIIEDVGETIKSEKAAISEAWELMKRDADKKLKQYKIQSGKSQLQKFPGSINGSTYAVKLNGLSVRDSENEVSRYLSGKLYITSSKHGIKKISSFNHKGHCDKARIIGYYKSPYENRIVVLYSINGFFMDEDYSDTIYCGAHFTKGYKKK